MLLFLLPLYLTNKPSATCLVCREEIEQFLCNDSSYTNRTLKEHPEYNYPAFVYAYQYKDTYQYGAMFPGYPGISGSGKDPQTALEDAYQRLSTFM